MVCPYSKPIPGVYGFNGRPVLSPCRTCYVCRSNRINSWTSRLNYEWTHSNSACFVRLSYDDNHLEYENDCRDNLPTLRRMTMHKYIDNLRHYCKKHKDEIYGCNPHFTYFSCGEYGDIGSRPHYHIIFFGLDQNTCRRLLKSTWHNGFVKVMPLKRGGIRYLMKYMEKQLYGEFSDRIYYDNGLESPFFSFTPGIGSKLYSDNRETLNRLGYIPFGSRKRVYPTPYYARKFFTFNARFIRSRNKATFFSKDLERSSMRLNFPGCYDLEQYHFRTALIREQNMQSRSRRDLHIVYINNHYGGN